MLSGLSQVKKIEKVLSYLGLELVTRFGLFWGIWEVRSSVLENNPNVHEFRGLVLDSEA